MLLIGGYLITNKSNNLAHLRWFRLLEDFGQCQALSWGSAVLALTYQSLCLAVHQGVMDITSCTPLLMSRIYLRFSQWCLADRGIYQYPIAASLYGDRMTTLLCRLCAFLGSSRRRSGGHGCQSSPLFASILCSFTRLTGFLTSTGRGEDVWWPDRHSDWSEGWRKRFDLGRRISIQHMFDTRPTCEYYNWWRGACRVMHLSRQEVLEDPRLAKLPPDVQSTTSQPRNDLHLP
ncbi:hypothetical protein Ahy_B03g062489 [Arachis hypogaea]|uniref:Aminotransferase-like plant mobile domain-containing protein n=1 Tax=Arachis hypogaea TaxID=3818 RepID=A0A444ZUT5_ARAHY|nr:hypothetical protein Ahy_B03g062489 [Arachis hypogaea]